MRVIPLAAAAAVLVAAAASAGCRRTKGVDEGDRSQVRLGDPVLRAGSVGDGEWERDASYVLVDAHNTSGGDLDVTLGGTLLDAAGEVVGRLRTESLRMPGGARRTFALVDDLDRAVPEAAGAWIEVSGASRPRWRPSGSLSDGHVFDDRGRVMVAATVSNDADRPGTLIVLAAFHDADGRPVARPHDVVPLGPRGTRTVRFLGPEGATTGTIFLGDSVY